MAAQSTVAIVAEKPSVARDIARVLNATKRGEGFLHGDGYVITWAIGHLVALAQPHEIRPEWKSWRRDLLPMLPEEWPLVVSDPTKDQFEVVRKILTSPKIGEVVCATDAGREGELIFRYIYEAAQSDKPVRRLWISSLTPDAIRDGFAKLKDGHSYDPLADAARGRSRADWLVGMNLSRAYTIACNEDLSVGRVQTPTLAMLVDRELAIRNFVPEDYCNVVATFSPRPKDSYQGTWFRKGVEPMDAATRLASDGEEAKAIVERVKTGRARIAKIEAQTKRMPPPLLYDLTELQRHANRLFGFSAQKTLQVAQALYERHKLISYPRTDSRHLSKDVAATLPRVVRAIAGKYQEFLAPATGERPLSARYVDDAKVSDHHALIPTGQSPREAGLDADEQRIFDLICRRLLSAWHDDHIWSVTTIHTVVESGPEPVEDWFHSSGTAVQQVGWKVLDLGQGKKKAKPKKGTADGDAGDSDGDSPGEEGQTLPPGLERNQPQTIEDAELINKRTRPPKRLTDASLLTAMETAGKTLDDKELSDAMKESGLGTPATRAQIIEVLLKRGFIERRGKSLEATDKGIRLIEVVHPEVKSPLMTGQWEAFLKRIEKGQAELQPFIQGIEDYVKDVVGKVKELKPSQIKVAASAMTDSPERARLLTAQSGANGAGTGQGHDAPLARGPEIPREKRQGSLREVLKNCFGFDSFRPNQEAVCHAVTSGKDVLLVMPTGSGKSLCYQLPGIVLGGTTIVISPLIALMEDQASKLSAMGFNAERIHSNRTRQASREACIQYLNGSLDFLFITPERFRVRGFPEMLAKRKPSLIAIDEAHCISQWGHDFRPDYRTMGKHLSALRPTPVIALTATATPMVQRDIARQLHLENPEHFIHGFWRDNIAIEVVKAPPSARFDLALQLLEDEERRPAIIYTPKRRDAEQLADLLSDQFSAAAYHAGLDGNRRDEVQKRFLDNKLEVVVATIAFGMGIDKPNVRTVIHTALPGSVEGYYQEIGRAGRDGEPSRAILMHSYADRYTHDFFFERDYPEADVLEKVYDKLTEEPQAQEAVNFATGQSEEVFQNALDKLWVHGGVLVDENELLTLGHASWKDSYLEQRDHKVAQFEKMISYCDVSLCRMQALVRYFGDRSESSRNCGQCDFCNPEANVAQKLRKPSPAELVHIERILKTLRSDDRNGDGVAAGRLYSSAFPSADLDRRGFEEMVGAMARAGLLGITQSSFEKDGKKIEFRRIALTEEGESSDGGTVLFAEEIASTSGKRSWRKAAGGGKTGKGGKAGASAAKKSKGRSSAKTSKDKAPVAAAASAKKAALDPGTGAALTAFKGWRQQEAKRKGVPAFRILSDQTLIQIIEQHPQSLAELLQVPGVGLRVAETYGAAIFDLLARYP